MTTISQAVPGGAAPAARPDVPANPAPQTQSLEQAINDVVQGALQGGQTAAERDAARDQLRAAVDRLRAEAIARGAGGGAITVQPPFPTDVIPPEAVDISVAFFTTVAFIIVGLPLARAFARRMDRRGQAAPASEMTPRLDRIEQALEAVAIEVERISENQRYATKVISELRGLPAPNPVAGWPASARDAEPLAREAGESRRP
jgi:hypothetical protein